MKHLLLSFFLIVTFVSQAQLLKDNFSSYTVGNDLNNQGGWTNNSSNPGGLGNCVGAGCTNQKVTSATLSFPNYGTSSKAVAISPERDGCGRGWATAVTTGSFYVSFLVNFSDIACGGTCTNDVDYFRILHRGDNFTTIARMFAKKTNSLSFQFGIEKGNNGAAARVYATTSINFNTTHLVVMKYTFNTGTNSDDVVRLYINPDMSLPEPSTADITSNLGNDNNNNGAIVLDAAAVSFRLNTAGLVPVGSYSLISAATQWNQLSHTAAAVTVIDTDLENVKVYAISAKQVVLQMNSNKTNMLTIEVTDVNGRIVGRQIAKLQPGVNQFKIETGMFVNGIYNIRAVGSKGVTPTVRFVKK